MLYAHGSLPAIVHDCDNMAASEGETSSMLSKLELELDPNYVSKADLAKIQAETVGFSDSVLVTKIEGMQHLAASSRFRDGGDKARKHCQLLQAELARRQDKIKESSKNWRQQVG